MVLYWKLPEAGSWKLGGCPILKKGRLRELDFQFQFLTPALHKAVGL